MNHGHESHDAGHHDSEARPYFPEKEWAEFQREDIQFGKAVVMLMGGIFSVGVFLYTIIAIVVGSG